MSMEIFMWVIITVIVIILRLNDTGLLNHTGPIFEIMMVAAVYLEKVEIVIEIYRSRVERMEIIYLVKG